MVKAIIIVFVRRDTSGLIVLYLFVAVTVATMENVQHPTHANVSEGEWERIVKSTAAAGDMELVNQIRLASVIKDSSSIQYPKNANFLAMVRVVINVTALT